MADALTWINARALGRARSIWLADDDVRSVLFLLRTPPLEWPAVYALPTKSARAAADALKAFKKRVKALTEAAEQSEDWDAEDVNAVLDRLQARYNALHASLVKESKAPRQAVAASDVAWFEERMAALRPRVALAFEALALEPKKKSKTKSAAPKALDKPPENEPAKAKEKPKKAGVSALLKAARERGAGTHVLTSQSEIEARVLGHDRSE